MSTAQVSFLSLAERLWVNVDASLIPQDDPYKYETVRSVVGRLISFTLFSPAAGLDLVFHSACIFPAVVYALGKSVWLCRPDFTLPWQHLLRVQNAVSPLLFASLFSLVHIWAGLALSESADKHAALGILTSGVTFVDTPCSPIRSLSIVKDMALQDPEVFPKEYLEGLESAIDLEESLESLEAQQILHRMSLTFHFSSALVNNPQDSFNFLFVRFLGILLPLLTVLDLGFALILETFFLTTWMLQLVAGRGPIYTEVTGNLLMHVSFLVHAILKTLGSLLATPSGCFPLPWASVPACSLRISFFSSKCASSCGKSAGKCTGHAREAM